MIYFDKDDHKDLRNTERIVGAVGSSHFGLGIRSAFLVASVLGQGAIIQVGDKGCGKTVCIDTVYEWAVRTHAVQRTWDKEITMAGADTEFNESLSGKSVLWISQDLAKLSPTVQEGMLKVVAAISQDKQCRVKTSMYEINITNCRLSYLAACAFDVYNQIWQIPAWRGSYSDRFLRLVIFPYRKYVNLDKPYIPKFTNCRDSEVVKDNGFKEVVKIFESQFGSERAFDYAQRYLRGIARTNGRDETTIADVKFLKLLTVNIESEKIIGSRDALTSPLFIDTDALYLLSECLKHKKVTKQEIVDRTRLLATEDSQIDEIIDDFPQFFKRVGKYILANSDFKKSSLKPQIDFEDYCVKMRKERKS